MQARGEFVGNALNLIPRFPIRPVVWRIPKGKAKRAAIEGEGVHVCDYVGVPLRLNVHRHALVSALLALAVADE